VGRFVRGWYCCECFSHIAVQILRSVLRFVNDRGERSIDLHQSLLNRVDHRSRPTRDPDFVVDMGEVVLYCFPANTQGPRNLRGIASLGEQA